MRGSVDVYKTLRGRPRLNIELGTILSALRKHGKVTSAAHELGCSQAYIHAVLKKAGLRLHQVMEADGVASLLEGGAG